MVGPVWRTWTLAMLVVALASVVPAGQESPAGGMTHHWLVNLDGTEGELSLRAAEDGRLEGTLLGTPVLGTLTGRRVILLREAPGGAEVWEGWIGTTVPAGADAALMAGSASVPGQASPVPWFAVPVAVPGGAPAGSPPRGTPPAGPPPAASTAAPSGVSPSPTPGPAREFRVAARPTPVPGTRPWVGGTWDTPDGPLEILQEGKALTFVLPDRKVTGRITGADSLIGGFGPGCCKGRIRDAGSVIAWDNGVTWTRADAGR